MSHKSIAFFAFLTLLYAVPVFAQTQPMRVENFVRIKGQEATLIRGYGVVSGLTGTGDDPKAYNPATTAILRELSRSGLFGSDAGGISGSRNNALVEVVATIPANGARDGDVLDCIVVAKGNAKSLADGVLSATTLGTALQQDENSMVQGIAHGSITIERTATPTRGRIANGCQIRADYINPYIRDGLVTLVIKKEHVRPKLANAIAKAINEDTEFVQLGISPARAINPTDVIVQMPMMYYAEPLDFIETIMDAEIMDVPLAIPRVTINESAGTIAIDENVEVKPTIVTHPNFIVDVEPVLAAGEQEQFPRQFLDLDTDIRFRQMSGEDVTNMKLRALQATMNSLRASQQDVIDVIKILQKQGAIVGEVVFVD